MTNGAPLQLAIIVAELRAVLTDPANLISAASRHRIDALISASVGTASSVYGYDEHQLAQLATELGAGENGKTW
jgi:hypothetical protein